MILILDMGTDVRNQSYFSLWTIQDVRDIEIVTYDCYRPFTWYLLQLFDGFKEITSIFRYLYLNKKA